MGNLAAVIIRMSQRDLHVRLHVTKVKITLLLANSFTYEVISKVLYLRTKTMSSYHHDFISTIIVPLSLSLTQLVRKEQAVSLQPKTSQLDQREYKWKKLNKQYEPSRLSED